MSTHQSDESQAPQITASEEALLALLDGGDGEASLESPALAREDAELLGLVARSLPPSTPRAGAKAKLFAELGVDLGGAVGTEGAAKKSAEAVLPFHREAANTAAPLNAPRSNGWLPLALAAAVLLAVGLGTWSGFLFSELRQSENLVAGLESELRAQALEPSEDAYQQAMVENQQLRRQIGISARPETKVCALSTMSPSQPDAAGAVFLRPQDGEWVLTTNNLRKCELGRQYRLWFMGEDGSVMGAKTLEHVNGDQQVELASGDLPEGTAAILVTLEFAEEIGEEPGGERVLYGDRAVEIF